MITSHSDFLIEENEFFTYRKELPEQKLWLDCQIHIGMRRFAEYQQDMLEEMIADVMEYLQGEEVSFEGARRTLETELKQLNTKLTVFSAKMDQTDRFPLVGHIHLMYEDQYAASLIGEASLLIFRGDTLVYSLYNQPTPGRIDLFSDLIEGDMVDDDKVVVVGADLDIYLDTADYAQLQMICIERDMSYAAALTDILSVRTDVTKLTYIQQLHYTTGKLFTQRNMKKGLSLGKGMFSNIQSRLDQHSKKLGYVIAAIFVLGLLRWSAMGLTNNRPDPIVSENGDVLLDVTLDDIQRDIAIFKQISASSNEKIKKYNEIVKQLDILEENGRRTFDVTQLRKVLEAEYSQGFNIELVNTLDQMQAPVYSFSQQEKNVLGGVREIFRRNGFLIGGTTGVLIGAINGDIGGSLVSAAIGQDLSVCGLNLLKNGLYCAANDGKIYMADSDGFSPVSLPAGITPPRAIKAIGTYLTSNMYLLTEDDRYVAKNQNIIKFKIGGNQKEFGKSTVYNLNDGFREQYPSAMGSGVASFSIDGNFLAWSEGDQSLYQLWRPDLASNGLDGRKLDIQGGDSERNAFTHQTKVMTTATSRYVYLFDAAKQMFSVYRTLPYKTINGKDKERTMAYFFTIQFDLGESSEVIDVTVEEGEKSNLYVMTSDDVFKMPLHEYLEKYHGKMAEDE